MIEINCDWLATKVVLYSVIKSSLNNSLSLSKASILKLQSYLEIINSKNDWDNPYHFPSVNRGLFWDDFMKEIDNRGGFGAIYQENFNKYVKSTVIFGKKHYTPIK